MPLLIGVDLGTSETKAGLFDLTGDLLRLSRREYPIIIEAAGCAEQSPETWWGAVCATLREVAAGVPPGELAALCIQGQGPSLVMLDEAGRPLHNALLWMDTRVAPEREELSARLGAPVSPFAHLPQALWLRRHCPEVYARARWFMTAWDFVAFRLCGRAATSTLAAFHPFPPAQVAAAELPASLFAPVVEAGRELGGLKASAAAETGLPEGLPVVAGVHDGLATFIGAGLVDVGEAADVGGASGGLALCWDRPIEEAGVFCEAWVQPGRYIVGGAMAALGKMVDWFREQIALPGAEMDALVADALTAPAGAGGLIFLPYLAGERAPIWDPLARGVFFGLTLHHTRAHLARAVLESAAFALRHLIERLEETGAHVNRLRICGRQARNAPINQLKADVTGLPVAVLRVHEAALLGAAVLAGAGVGLLPDVVAGMSRMARIAHVLQPEPARQRRYSELYGVYRRLYPDLRAAFHQLAQIPL